MTAPTLQTVLDYLDIVAEGEDDPEIVKVGAAMSAELANMCQILKPKYVAMLDDDEAAWPVDLIEALCRRVARNLAMRGLPLGVQPSLTDAGVVNLSVGGRDPEIKRFEAPYRKVLLG